jgi:energy-coupling factor transport system substrate-specific component
MRKSYFFLALILAIGVAAFIIPLLPESSLQKFMNWGLLATILVILAVIAFFFEFESAAVSSKEIALVAMLGTISAVLRVPFAVIPNVQPCTYLIICSGYVFGPVAGFMVGAVTALVSNILLGQGPWTLYQMFAWGLAGVSAAYIRQLGLGRVWLIIFGVIWGYLYGWIMNIWYWVAFIYPLTPRTFFVYQLTSIWFDTLHAIGNALLLGLLGTKTIAILERFKQRFNWRLASRASYSSHFE